MHTRMTFVAFSVAALAGAVSAGAQTYNQVWSDEFNAPVSNSNWQFETGGGGWGNNELQYYQSANATVANSILTIQARRENVGGNAYTSARMNSAGRREYRYGKVEARIKGQSTQGLWPAFWMLGANFGTAGWPGCGEIDILEHINHNNTAFGTIHWDNGGYVSYTGSAPQATFSAWHTYGIIWDANAINWQVDGVTTGSANILNNINGTEEFHRPFFMIMNLAVGGNWPGNPDGTTVLPYNYEIDYVRVAQVGAATATPTRTATATTGATATPTRTPSPTATTGGGTGCWVAWSSTATYTGGAQVSRTCGGVNENFEAAFWTQGNDPCTNRNTGGNGEEWYPRGTCGGATATATRTATATATRTATATATTGATATISATPARPTATTARATATRTATATATRTATATATPTTGGACAGIPAFQSCTAYASGAQVTYNGSKYHAIAPIPNNRDCPPNSPYTPATDNWWVNDGGC